ncbi:MAG: alpha/beta hydrolase, partial [Acidimicrobiia bacterium]
RFETVPHTGRTLPQEHLVPLREVTIHLVDWPGDEPAIVAIHGSGGLGMGQAALAECLSPTHRVVALDLRGHGLSDKPPAGYRLGEHVSDVTQLIEALGLRRPVVMGHSAGGTIAAFVAGQASVSGLILLEGMIGDRAFTENAAVQAAPLAEGLGQPIAGFDAYLDSWRAQRRPFSGEAERLLDRWVRYALEPLPDGTYRSRALRSAVEAEWASIVAADSLGALQRVSCPILIVQAVQPWLGGRPYFTDEIVAAQLRAASGAQLYVAIRSDHASLIRDPEPEMVDAVLTFLQRCRVLASVSGSSSGMNRHDRTLS